MKNKGFTLTELLGVMVIFGIVMTLAVVSVNGILNIGKSSAYVITDTTIKTAARNYVVDNIEDVVKEINTTGNYKLSYNDLNSYIDNATFSESYGKCDDSYVIVSKSNANTDYDFEYDVCMICKKDGIETYKSSNCK